MSSEYGKVLTRSQVNSLYYSGWIIRAK